MPDSGIAALTPVTGLNVTLTDRVLSVRINRPSSLNSLTVPILTGIADTLGARRPIPWSRWCA